ncbi:hypothetical protein CERZMDRAFT_45640, partial [Cercospora zeae-maydis SCOH1-5]
PEGVTWPTEYREHALKLMKFLLEIRGYIDRTESYALQSTNTQIKKIAAVGGEKKEAAKEAIGVGKVRVAIIRDRKIIVNIRNPVTIERLRAINPRNLKSYVNRALE